MKGLIKKDLFVMRKNLKLIFLFAIIFSLSSLEKQTYFYIVPSLITMMTFMSTFSYDDYNKWDAYAITLPNGRKNVVKAKYIANIIVFILTILLTYIWMFFLATITQKINILELGESMFGVALAMMIIQSISYPLIFKFGIEKGRIGMAIGIFTISACVGFLFQNFSFEVNQGFLQFLDNYGIYLFSLVCILSLFLSCKLSERFYQKKEF